MEQPQTFGECTTPDGVTHKIIKVLPVQTLANTKVTFLLLDDKSIVIEITDVTNSETPLSQHMHLQIPQYAMLMTGMYECVQRFGIDMNLVMNTLIGEAQKETVK